jgi:hypothetical protein
MEEDNKYMEKIILFQSRTAWNINNVFEALFDFTSFGEAVGSIQNYDIGS